MRTALDTSVLVDLLLDDPTYGKRSHEALSQARTEGTVILCDVVVAELGPLISPNDIKTLMTDLNIQYVATSLNGALSAAEMFGDYIKRGGKRGRIVPDFLIGSHAQNHADRLLARDRGFFRDYFSELVVWYPSNR